MCGSTKKKLLLIGAGPTSSLISYKIAKHQKLNESLDVQVWEKCNELGGRFKTSRSSKNPDCFVDLGAQYLTQTHSHSTSKLYFDDLREHNLIGRLDTEGIPGFRSEPTKTHFACTKGTSSIVKHFFEQAGLNCKVCFNKQVSKLKPMNSGLIEVTTAKETTDTIDTFDFVVSTIPVPQLLNLKNFFQLVKDNSEVNQNLKAVKYSTRFALGIFFDRVVKLETFKHALHFVDNNPAIRYWSIENFKRTGNWTQMQQPTSILVHSSVGYGADNSETDEESVKSEIFPKVQKLVPEVKALHILSVTCHRWEQSQVLEAYLGTPGCVRLTRGILAAGDGFSYSGFERCIESAEKVISALQSMLCH